MLETRDTTIVQRNEPACLPAYLATEVYATDSFEKNAASSVSGGRSTTIAQVGYHGLIKLATIE